jgi:hypothetical protein
MLSPKRNNVGNNDRDPKPDRQQQDDQHDGQDDAAVAHVTVMWVCADPLPQVTVIGHAPGVVFAPTFHVQLTLPAAFDIAGAKPAAVDGPDL